MNHLGHLSLAKHHSDLMAGVFLGDFVKGRLAGERPEQIETGIRFHRAIDVFVDNHESQKRSVHRFDSKYQRYGGIICDVIYDHLLAVYWHEHHEENFLGFCRTAYDAVLKDESLLPSNAHRTITQMQIHQSLENYLTVDYIERSLRHIGLRLTRANPLSEAHRLFEEHGVGMKQDFDLFMPDTINFANAWLAENR